MPCLRGQAPPLPVRESETAGCELSSKHPALFLEIVDHVALLSVDSVGHGHDEEPQRLWKLTHYGLGCQRLWLASPTSSGRCHTENDGAPQARGVVPVLGHYEIYNDENS